LIGEQSRGAQAGDPGEGLEENEGRSVHW
jgi:hypothetical protein